MLELQRHLKASARRVEKPWGYELVWTTPDLPYVGKIIHIKAGARLSLQVHDAKTETWLLLSGRVLVTLEDDTGVVTEFEMQPATGYTCGAGRKHRLAGITECEILEVSTPEVGVTHRLHDDYGRPDEVLAPGATLLTGRNV
jgi:mannose-6-phosphate isomerase-like protein (cupin superfamily)